MKLSISSPGSVACAVVCWGGGDALAQAVEQRGAGQEARQDQQRQQQRAEQQQQPAEQRGAVPAAPGAEGGLDAARCLRQAVYGAAVVAPVAHVCSAANKMYMQHILNFLRTFL